MQALVYDPDQPAGLRLAEVAEPVRRPDEALVEVRAISLNFGELAYRAGQAQPGEVHGWDAAGVVAAAAEDGSGPAPGTPVITFGWNGAWARLRRAVSTAEMAVLPDFLDPGMAAALPVAGVTALRAVRRLGSILPARGEGLSAASPIASSGVRPAARATT